MYKFTSLMVLCFSLIWIFQAASAAWNMGEWDQMAEYVKSLDDGDETKSRVLGNTSATGDASSNGTFYRAVLLVRQGKVGLHFSCVLQCFKWFCLFEFHNYLLNFCSTTKPENILRRQEIVWPQSWLLWYVLFKFGTRVTMKQK